MFEFIETNISQIAVVFAILGPLTPIIRKRIVSDKHMMKVFGDIKELSSKVKFKATDINDALKKIDMVQKNFQVRIDNFQNQIDDRMKIIDQSITNFTDSELYQRMLNGLEQLNNLDQLLENKNSTIQELGETIKSINQKFLEIKNRLK